jgi:hypothetical protein
VARPHRWYLFFIRTVSGKHPRQEIFFEKKELDFFWQEKFPGEIGSALKELGDSCALFGGQIAVKVPPLLPSETVELFLLLIQCAKECAQPLDIGIRFAKLLQKTSGCCALISFEGRLPPLGFFENLHQAGLLPRVQPQFLSSGFHALLEGVGLSHGVFGFEIPGEKKEIESHRED